MNDKDYYTSIMNILQTDLKHHAKCDIDKQLLNQLWEESYNRKLKTDKVIE